MPLVSASIPNMVGGVSQQPSALRALTACESLLNGYPSVVTGLHKRQPTVYKAEVYATAPTSSVAGHMIDRRSVDPFIVTIADGDLKVHNASTGASKTVTFPDGKTYLASSDPASDFAFLTIADTTFIVNKTITTAVSTVTETRTNPATRGSVYVYQAVGNSNYNVYIDGTLKANYATSSSGAVAGTLTIAEDLRADLAAAGYTVGRNGSTVSINLTSGNELVTSDDYGDEAIKSFKDALKTFADLPPYDEDNRIVKIKGDVEVNGDDYYVQYINGVWEETYGYNAGEQLNASTMPHVLVDNGDGTWTFKKYAEWAARTAGDADSNPSPSFIGAKIRDIFVHKNRMGFVADENVIFSEVGEYGNFYRTTLTQLVDSDPIDVSSPTTRVAQMNWGVPFNQTFLLFSDKAQFKVTENNNLLSPKTIGVLLSASFSVSQKVRPVNVGPNIMFVEDASSGQYASLYEYFVDKDTGSDDASEVTAQVPYFIPSGVYKLAASNDNNVMVALTSGARNKLWLYKYFWGQQGKLQSAWGVWEFPSDFQIMYADFVDNILYMLVKRTDGMYLVTADIEDGATNFLSRFGVLLDMRLSNSQVTESYNAGTDVTTITLPYALKAGETVQVVTSTNVLKNVVSASGTSVGVSGDITALTYYVGIPYNFEYEFSTLYMRAQAGNGTVAIQDGRVQVRYISIRYKDTAYFTTEFISEGRDPFVSVYTGRAIGSPENTFGNIVLDSGKFRFATPGENEDISIKIKSDSPFPCSFVGAEWEATYYPITIRRG